MKNFLMLLSISIFFFSCEQKEKKQSTVSTPITNAKLNVQTKEEKVQENKQIGDTIYMDFKNDKGEFIAEGSLDSINSRIYLKFKNEDSGELNAKIIPSTGKGNIRFNQIIFPDKTADGPFGMDLKINLKQKGNYIFVIGHSQMADNPFYGNFKVLLEK